MKYVKFFALFLVIFLGIALNLPDGAVARLGFEANYMIAAGVALLITWLSTHHNVFVVSVIVILVAAANVPEETAHSIGYDRDIVLAALVAVIVLPTILKMLDMD